MRIIAWNVNGIRAAVRNGLLQWLEKTQPDILCVQEVKASPQELDTPILKPPGYRSFWQPARRRGYSGVGVYVKKRPLSVRPMGIDAFDAEGRVQVIEYKRFTLVNAYFPNSQPERRRIAYKLAFCNAMIGFCNALRDAGRTIIISGDYNIAHTEIDLARPRQNTNSPGFLPEERAAMTRFLAAGYVDTFRHFCKEPGHYTWWSYRTDARARNVGWRIDYHCVNKEFVPHVRESTILSEVMGADHCPVAITIK